MIARSGIGEFYIRMHSEFSVGSPISLHLLARGVCRAKDRRLTVRSRTPGLGSIEKEVRGLRAPHHDSFNEWKLPPA